MTVINTLSWITAMSLFRDEVLTHRVESLHGTISLLVPVSWQVISLSLAAIIGIAGAFLLSASYSRTEVAAGSVLPAGGILQIVPSKPGRVEAIEISEGQVVHAGEALARIRAEQIDDSGIGTQTAILSAIGRQERSLQQQEAYTRSAGLSEQSEFESRISGLGEQGRGIDQQIDDQTKLVDLAKLDLDRAEQISSRGFVSKHDLASRQETLISRQQQLAALRETKDTTISSLQQAIRARREAAAKASELTAALITSQAQIDRERATARGEQGYSLVAPADGQVAALNINVGDAIGEREPVMTIVPSGSPLIARMYIPGKAIGFIRNGQPVRLALNAYPYERFGTVAASITVVASVPIMRPGKGGDSEPFYIATASIQRPWIQAYGRRERLLPGMAFTANILIERHSVFRWLFDPLSAAAR